MTNDEPITADEQTIRQIAREEARDIYDIDVEDGDGETWSLFKLMDSFGIRRRTALKAMGLMALGSSSTVAVLRAMSGSAEGATGSAGQIGTDTDRPDIYGDSADLNSVSTDEVSSSSEPQNKLTFGDYDISDGGTANLEDDVGYRFDGFVFITKPIGSDHAIVSIRGSAQDTTLIHNGGGAYSTTQGNAGTTNIYHDGSYKIENQTGGDQRYELKIMAGPS